MKLSRLPVPGKWLSSKSYLFTAGDKFHLKKGHHGSLIIFASMAENCFRSVTRFFLPSLFLKQAFITYNCYFLQIKLFTIVPSLA